MPAGKIRSLIIIILSCLCTAYTCGKAIIKSTFGIISRKWCDEEIQRWVTRLAKIVRVNLKIINPYEVKPQKNEATIIMCNHSSLYDIPLSLLAFPQNSVRMLAKKELFKVPIMGKGMMAAEFPFIDREDRRQAIKDLEKVKELLNSGIIMWIAPEGTRSKDGKLQTFKKGGFITAIKTNATIIPIGIRGANHILSARSKQFNLNQIAEVHIGKPIKAGEYTLANKDELITKVHSAMQSLINSSS